MEKMAEKQLEVLLRQFKELTRVYRDAVSHSGVSENVFWIWYSLILFDDEYSQQDLSNIWSLAKQTVNNIITQMVHNKYVILELVPDSRNRKIIRLTDRGRQYGASIVKPIFEAEKRVLQRIDPGELVACTTALTKFTSILKEEIDEG